MIRLIRTRQAGLLALDLLLLAVIAPLFPGFITPGNLAGVFDDTALLILLAIGEMLVLLTRGVDLSVAAIVGLVNENHPDWGVAPVILIAITAGAALGAFNGLLVWLLRVPSIVVTLGTLSVYRGSVFLASGGRWVNANQMSPAFLGLVRQKLLGLTMLSWTAILVAVLIALFLRFTRRGRDLYAAGNNPAASIYAGIEIGRMQFTAFTIAGAIAGLCGYLWVARFAVAYTDIANGFELQVIAACVIGGISTLGGVGGVAGVVLGALFLGIIKNALPLVGISPFFQMAVSGAVITGAVLINARTAREAPRRILERA
jgi:rhamnose transport system permease protein